MSSEFERSGESDPTTPMFEGLLPQPTEEMPRPSWDSNASIAPPPAPMTTADDVNAPPPTPLSAPASVSAPAPPPPVDTPNREPATGNPQTAFQAATMESPAPRPPQPGPPRGGPTVPNYAAPGAPIPPPVPVESLVKKGFTPSRPPEPPDGPGKRAGGGSRLSRWGWRSLVAFLAGGLIAAAGFAAGEINDPEVVAPATGPTPTSIVVRDADNPIEAVDEPASLVAELLGPSVVRIETDFGLGSGVIYRDGYILTNNHVIEDAERLNVQLSTGENFDAELVGSDASKDLAVLSVGERDLPVAQLALDTEVRVGQTAIAIGSPFNLQQTVTAGIVSAVNRPVPSRTPQVYVAMIQTDAPINPGNSGGALADRDGRVIGINTAIQTDGFSGTNAGVGFAIPIDDAVRIADLLVAGEPIEPGYLGVSGKAPDGGEAGVEIAEVTTGSAAEMAGVEVGDRVLSMDEAPVTSITELAGLVLARQAGDEVTLRVVRNGEEMDIGAVLGSRP